MTAPRLSPRKLHHRYCRLRYETDRFRDNVAMKVPPSAIPATTDNRMAPAPRRHRTNRSPGCIAEPGASIHLSAEADHVRKPDGPTDEPGPGQRHLPGCRSPEDKQTRDPPAPGSNHPRWRPRQRGSASPTGRGLRSFVSARRGRPDHEHGTVRGAAWHLLARFGIPRTGYGPSARRCWAGC